MCPKWWKAWLSYYNSGKVFSVSAAIVLLLIFKRIHEHSLWNVHLLYSVPRFKFFGFKAKCIMERLTSSPHLSLKTSVSNPGDKRCKGFIYCYLRNIGLIWKKDSLLLVLAPALRIRESWTNRKPATTFRLIRELRL